MSDDRAITIAFLNKHNICEAYSHCEGFSLNPQEIKWLESESNPIPITSWESIREALDMAEADGVLRCDVCNIVAELVDGYLCNVCSRGKTTGFR